MAHNLDRAEFEKVKKQKKAKKDAIADIPNNPGLAGRLTWVEKVVGIKED